MRRPAFQLGLALFLALAGAGVSGTLEVACSRLCPDARPDGTCPPDCGDCPCCTHVRFQLVELELKDAPVLEEVAVAEGCAAPPESPEPGEILHVPRLGLA